MDVAQVESLDHNETDDLEEVHRTGHTTQGRPSGEENVHQNQIEAAHGKDCVVGERLEGVRLDSCIHRFVLCLESCIFQVLLVLDEEPLCEEGPGPQGNNDEAVADGHHVVLLPHQGHKEKGHKLVRQLQVAHDNVPDWPTVKQPLLEQIFDFGTAAEASDEHKEGDKEEDYADTECKNPKTLRQ